MRKTKRRRHIPFAVVLALISIVAVGFFPVSSSASAPESRMSQYLELEARRGRLAMAADFTETHLTTADGTQVSAVMEAGATVADVQVMSSGTEATAVQTADYGIAFVNPSEEASAAPQLAIGFAGAFNVSGMDKKGGVCRTTWFNPKWAHNSDHRLTTCYEKWKSRNADEWIYNRWAWFTRGEQKTRYSATYDFTIRSRPWQGTADRVTAMLNHTDAFPSSCNQVVNVGLSAGPGSLTIPINRCSNTEILENAGKRSGGMDWDGRSSGQIKLDFGMALRAKDKNVTVTYADYSWMSVCRSRVNWLCTSGQKQHLKRADSGY